MKMNLSNIKVKSLISIYKALKNTNYIIDN